MFSGFFITKLQFFADERMIYFLKKREVFIMNANLNEIFKLINPSNTIGVNRFLAHAVGAAEAIVYSALLAKSAYYEEREMISDGWFFSTVSDLEESTAMSEKQQRKAINNLIKAGLICSERRGMPAKRFFKISGDLEKLKDIIALGEKIIAEKFGVRKTQTRKNPDDISAEEFAEYPKPKSRETAPCSSAEMSEQVQPKAPDKFRQNAAVPYKTKINNQNKKSSADDDDLRGHSLSALKSNVRYDELCVECPNDKSLIDDLLEIMLDVICSKKEKVRVNGDNKARCKVSEVYLNLKKQHFISALNAIKNNPNPVFNRHGYIITVLYNSFGNTSAAAPISAPKPVPKLPQRKSSFDVDRLKSSVMAKYAKGGAI